MKKAYILTFFYGDNYGSKLQATALRRYLKELDYDSIFIKTFLDFSFMIIHPSLFFTRVLNFLNRRKRDQFFITEEYVVSQKRQERISKYNEDNLPFITIKKHHKWKQIIAENPVFISGSDIIWQPAMGYPDKYFLDFAYYTNCRRISYASSIGAKALPAKYNIYYKKYLGSYDAISVRENASKELFAKIIDNDITKVVDPTLLLERGSWDELAEKAVLPEGIIKGKYILCYFVMKDMRYWDYVKKAAQKEDLQTVVLPMHYADEQMGDFVITDGTPYEFIWLIKNAEFIITDSFHASVFSLLYEKEAYILKRERQDEDEKFNDLLTRYCMQDRMVLDETGFERKPFYLSSSSRANLKNDREFAKQYLIKALEE